MAEAKPAKEPEKNDVGSPNFSFDVPNGSLVVLEGEDGTMVNIGNLLKDVDIANVHIISPLTFSLSVECDDVMLTGLDFKCKAYPSYKHGMTMSQFPRVVKPEFISTVKVELGRKLKGLINEQMVQTYLTMFVEFEGIKYRCVFLPDLLEEEKIAFMMF